MLHESFTGHHRLPGRGTALAVFSLLIAYAVTLVPGLLSLTSPEDPIGPSCPGLSILPHPILSYIFTHMCIK